MSWTKVEDLHLPLTFMVSPAELNYFSLVLTSTKASMRPELADIQKCGLQRCSVIVVQPLSKSHSMINHKPSCSLL